MSAAKHVYLSYAWPDRAYAESLGVRLANQNIASVVNDGESRDAREKLAQAGALIVIVGETTHRSSFVDWEASLAREMGKPVVVVKLDPGSVLPSRLYDVPATWTDISRIEAAVATALEGSKDPP